MSKFGIDWKGDGNVYVRNMQMQMRVCVRRSTTLLACWRVLIIRGRNLHRHSSLPLLHSLWAGPLKQWQLAIAPVLHEKSHSVKEIRHWADCSSYKSAYTEKNTENTSKHRHTGHYLSPEPHLPNRARKL